MTTVRRGRPRSAAIDEAILDATVEELIAHGFSGVTIEAVAERAGVARTTVYRRWADVTELVVAAVHGIKDGTSDPPAGSVRDQLVWLLDRMRRTWNEPRFAAVMRRVSADATARPQLYRESRDRLIAPQVAIMNAVLRRGVDEGLIRADLDLDWIRTTLVSPVIASSLTLRDPVSRRQAEAVVDVVLRGVAP